MEIQKNGGSGTITLKITDTAKVVSKVVAEKERVLYCSELPQ